MPLEGNWSLGDPYFPNDLNTKNLSAPEWVTSLRYSDYLFLARVDAQFWNTYGAFFAPEDRYAGVSLYRIEGTDSGSIRVVAQLDTQNQKLIIARNAERLIVPNPSRLIEESKLTPFDDAAWEWLSPHARVDDGIVKIEGMPTTSYFAISDSYRLPKGAFVAATVNARRSGIILGLLDENRRWAATVVVPPGRFRAVVEAPEHGKYHIAIGQASAARARLGDDLFSNAV